MENAVQKELDRPGRLLGYRAMNQKLRTKHHVKVPRHLTHNVMGELDPGGLDARNLQKKKKPQKVILLLRDPYGWSHYMVMTNFVATRTGPSLLVFTAVLTHFLEKFYFYLAVPQILTLLLWERCTFNIYCKIR